LRRLFPFRRIRPSLLVPMAMTVLGLHIVLSEMDNLLRSVLPPPDDIMEIFRSLGEGTWATALTLVVVAPVTEELFFRGVVLGGFLRNYRSVTAVLLSSLLFAVIHLNPWQFAAAFILGIVFAWWFIRTESLWPSLLGHTLANGLVAVILYFPLEIPGYNVISPDTPLQPWWFDLAGAVLALTGLLWTRHLFRRHL
jgi:membrane protease YdiL (CAAX protease family)